MADTLIALHRAVVASPEDRTVRLVYADALDETGVPVHTARAEFIRTQIELESAQEAEARYALLTARRDVLFDEHWLSWWRPVAAAAGLPAPVVSRRRVRDRVVRVLGQRVRAEKTQDWPYTHTTQNSTVQLADYGMSVRFAGGFPEEVRFLNLDAPINGPELVHRWGDAMPLVRLAFASYLTPVEWARVDGPHLSRLAELSLDRLMGEVTPNVAASPHLAALTRLAVHPVGANAESIRALVSGVAWTGLRSLQFTGRLSAAAVAGLATACSLPELEELVLTLGNPGDLSGVVGQLLGDLIRRFTQVLAFPDTAERWPEYGAALEALAAATWVRRLRRLRLTTGTPGLLGLLGERLAGTERPAGVLPDAAVMRLADALDMGLLERFELPTEVVSLHVRETLTARLGGRVLFTS